MIGHLFTLVLAGKFVPEPAQLFPLAGMADTYALAALSENYALAGAVETYPLG
jgi:hypothetical protein